MSWRTSTIRWYVAYQVFMLVVFILLGYLVGKFWETGLLGAEKRVSIRASWESGVTCLVPRAQDNQWLNIGVAQYLSHGVQLNGLPTDAYANTVVIPALDCQGEETVTAFCELFYGQKGFERATQNLACR